MRSASMISTPSNPAAAQAWSFSTSPPDRQTVAIEVRMQLMYQLVHKPGRGGLLGLSHESVRVDPRRERDGLRVDDDRSRAVTVEPVAQSGEVIERTNRDAFAAET